jgi:magnesium-transporting ATPase (P-type)
VLTSPWSKDADQVERAVDTDTDTGLTSHEVERRLERYGPNELDATPPDPKWQKALQQFNDPLVFLLLFAIVISLIAWAFDGAEEAPVEAIVIAIIVIANAVIGYWQEAKATKAVEALQELAATRASVVRDGRVESIPNTQLVPGDVVILAEGDAVGADCRLLEAATLRIAEAPLTGESAPVTKQCDPLPADTEVADRTNMVFNGTGVASGRGRGVVVATGMTSEIGRIASLLDSATEERTPLQKQIDWLGKVLGITVIILAAIVVGAIMLTSDVSSAADMIDALLVGVSLAVAAVPEGLPAILTIVLALGVQRMAAHNAIVKKLSSVETLGSASVICTDKTGTLTRNEMTIVRVVTASVDTEISGSGYEPIGRVISNGSPLEDPALLREIDLVLEAGSLANDATLREGEAGSWEALGDPTEAAFLVAERKLGITERREARYQRVGEIPFNSDRKLMTTIDRDAEADGHPDRSELMLVTKGAPDVLVNRCSHERIADEVVVLTPERREAILTDVEGLADSALRTLAVAYRRLDDLTHPIDESIENDLIHLGVVGIVDPPRLEVAAAIDEAQGAGVRVIMITGDHPRTAARIGDQLGIGLAGSDGVTGRELAEKSDEQFADTVRNHSVFARVSPEQKLRIVETLQADSEIVAMTGDGVNDAPALRQAEIGVAMGVTGTEVSKEAADMILADDNFATILRAVREGREIFADIQKFLRYLLASNTGEVLVMFIGVLAAGALGLTDTAEGLAVPLLATQILWINLVTDSALALALGVDPAVENVMEEKPRRLTDRVIDRSMLVTIILIGTVTAAAGLIALDLELAGGMLGGSGEIGPARTMVFTTVVLAQIFNAFNSRSDRVSAFVRPFDNGLLWAAAALTVLLQIAVVHLPPLNRAFDTDPLDARQWLICVVLSSTVLIADEIRKLIVRWR